MAWHQNYDDKLESYRTLSAGEKSLFHAWDDTYEDWTGRKWTTGVLDWYYKPGGGGRDKPSLGSDGMNLAAFLDGDADLRMGDLPSRGSSADFMVFGGDGVGDDDGDNHIETGDREDIVIALGGDDTIISGGGADLIHAGTGDDTVVSGSGNDLIHAGEGADLVNGGSGADEIHGDSGDDSLSGGSGGDTVYGGTGRDVLANGGFDGIDSLRGDDETGAQETDTFWLGGGDPAAFDYGGALQQAAANASSQVAMKFVGVAAELALNVALDSKWSKKFFLGSTYEAVRDIIDMYGAAAQGTPSADYGDNDYTVIEDFDPRHDKIYLKFGDWGSGSFRDTDAYWDNSTGQATKEIYYDGELMAKIRLDERLMDEIDDGDGASSDEQAQLLEILDAVWDQRAFMGVDQYGTETYVGLEASYEYDSDDDGVDDATVQVFGENVSADDLMGRGEGLVTLGNWGAVDWTGDGDEGTVWGTHSADVLRAEGGSVPGNTSITIHGWDGSDVIVGGGGSDRLFGGQGADYIYGGDTTNTSTRVLYDYISGGEGADWIAAGRGFNIVDGGSHDLADNGGDADGETSTLYDAGDTASYASLGRQDDGIGVTVDLRDQADLTTLLSDLDGDGLLDEYRDAGLLATTDNGSDDLGNGGAYGDVLSGIENVVGSRNSDTITGDAADNVIATGAGGTDALDGGDGTDVVDFHRLAAAVTASLVTGTYSSASGSGTIANFEGMRGTDAADVLTGDAGENLFHGTLGADTIYGGEGWDTYDATAIGAVSLAVTYVADEEMALVFGFEGSTATLRQTLYGVEEILFDGTQTSTGGPGNDIITGGSGDDVINGHGGDDTIRPGAGRDTVYGGAGDDVLHDGEGRDYLYGGDDDDVFYVVEHLGGTNEGTDRVHGGEGYDIVYVDSDAADFGRSYNGTYLYGAGVRIYPDVEHVVLGSGDDVYDGFQNHDDVIDGGDGNDLILTQTGDDRIIGSRGSDEISGGSGDDTLDYSAFDRAISVHLGSGTVAAYNGSGVVATAAGITQFRSIETVLGTAYDDIFSVAKGGWLNTSMTFEGGNGTDAVAFGDNLSAYTLNLRSDGELIVWRSGHTATLHLRDVETISFAGVAFSAESLRIGTGSRNTLHGSAGDDLIIGNAGNDTLKGSWGDDTFVGGAGNDSVRGDWAGGDQGHTDTAVYFGRVSEYAITRSTTTIAGSTVSRIVVDDLGAGSDGIDEGVDTLIAVERLQFADVTLTLDDLDRTIFVKDGGNRNAGTASDDIIVSRGDGTGAIFGGHGSDTFHGSAGSESFYGIDWDAKNGGAHASTGTDTVRYAGNMTDFEVTVANRSAGGKTFDFISVMDRADGGTDGLHEGFDNLAFIERIAFADQTISGLNVVAGADLGTARGAETLRGSGAASVIFGNGGNDTIFGEVHNDIIVGGAGNDTIYGGFIGGDHGGGDAAVYSGRVHDYLITGSGDLIEVWDLNRADADVTNDGRDTLHYVEYLRFVDITLRSDAIVVASQPGDGEMVQGGGTGRSTEYLMGGDDDSTLWGAEGVDTYFIDRGGDDTFKAGGTSSVDTVIYAGAMADYSLDLVGETGSGVFGTATSYYLEVTDLGDGIDGVDEGRDLIGHGVDYLQFADGRLAVTDAIDDLRNEAHRFEDGAVSVTVAENASGAVHDAEAGLDNPDGDALTWSLDGTDAARFAIDAAGVLRLITAPDHEAPADADGDNVYEATVIASDGFANARQDVTVTVENVVELSTVGGTTSATMSEKATGTGGTLTLANVEAGGASFVAAATAGSYGALSVAANGAWTYARTADMSWLGASESHVETFAVATTDGVTTQVAVTVTGVNDAPEAPDLILAPLAAGDTLVMRAADYAGTATDVDSDTIDLVSLAIHAGGGTLTDNGDDTYTYAADPGDDGAVRFVYTVSDGALTDTGFVDLDLA